MVSRVFLLSVALGVLQFTSASRSEGIDAKADAFANLFLTTCMRNINDVEALRNKLITNQLPKFPPEQARLFLQGQLGDAWPVPQQGQLGNFVLALPSGKSFCTLLARRANATEVERNFIALVSKAPTPMMSERGSDDQSETIANGKTRTISYTWTLPQANKKMLFMLTTSSSESAQLQALGSASIISE